MPRQTLGIFGTPEYAIGPLVKEVISRVSAYIPMHNYLLRSKIARTDTGALTGLLTTTPLRKASLYLKVESVTDYLWRYI